MDNFIEEYLVAIGAKTDSQSFDEAKKQTDDLEKSLKRIEKNTAFVALLKGIEAFITAGKFAIDVIKKIGNTLYENIVGVAKADMGFMKLARSMWVTKETAKSLQMAMDEMGASMQDIAWIPELRDQFYRLREEINQFSTPADADEQLKYIRSIGYDIQVLMIRLKMLREWVVYYLVKYLKPFMDEFKSFIKWLSDQIGGRMSTVAKKFAQIMGSVIGSIYSAFKIASKVIQSVVEWIAELPENVKKWAAIFSAVGAAIMAGPFGILLAAIGAAFVLLQDFVYYMNGWSSSRTMAPIWEMLVKFTRGTGSNIMAKIKEFLSDVADILDYIINELNIRQVFDGIKDALWEIVKGSQALWNVNIKRVKEFLKLFNIGKPQVSSFFGAMAKNISNAILLITDFAKLLGKLIQIAAKVKDGKLSEAWDLFKGSVTDFADNASKRLSNIWENNKKFYSDTWNGVKKQAAALYGGGTGNATETGEKVVENASQFGQGYKWFDPTGENTTSDRQCASFASQMMEQSGVDVEVTMNGDALAKQFKDVGAYHSASEGYEPQPGDLIDWAHHVGIYAGNGQYIARNSDSGVVRGDMEGMEQYFGELWGFGSVAELQAAKTPAEENNDVQQFAYTKPAEEKSVPAAGLVSGDREMAMSIPQFQKKEETGFGQLFNLFKKDDKTEPVYAESPEIPMQEVFKEFPSSQDVQGSYADMASSIVSGDQEMIIPPSNETVNTSNSTINLGGISIGDIIIGGTKATPKEIAQAVQDGVKGAIDFRFQRGLVT